MAAKTPLNGISWMLRDPAAILDARARLELQCPVTQKVQCMHRPDPDLDPVLNAWEQGLYPHQHQQHHRDAPTTVPAFTQIVLHQEMTRI